MSFIDPYFIIALNKMLNEEPLKLSDKGIKILDSCWENSSSQSWTIQAINSDKTLKVVSDNDLIFKNAGFDWFILS